MACNPSNRPIWRGKLEYVQCNLCDSRSTDSLLVFDDSWRLVKCKKCGLVFVNPRPRQDDLIGGYQKWGSSEDESDIARIRNSTVPALRYEVKRIVNSHSHKGRVLDVGSGCGFFLKLMKNAGWDVLGVDPSESFAEYAAKEFGVETVPGTIETVDLRENRFDVVTMWYVLEHVMDPRGVVNRAYSLLKQGGLFVLRVPNYTFGKPFAFLQKMGLNVSNLGVFSVPWHLYFFDRLTLPRLLEYAGFQVASMDHGTPYYGQRRTYNAVKRAVTVSTEAVRRMSFGQLFWGPAIVVRARKS